jgi:DNA processing protein
LQERKDTHKKIKMSAASQELFDDIILSMIEGVGSRTYQKLVQEFGSATAILDRFSRSDVNRFDFLKPETAQRLLTARKDIDPTATLALCEREQIRILSLRDNRYPNRLRSIIDPPPLLYVKGTLLPQDAFSIAIVGTRRVSPYGRRQTIRLVKALVSNGLTIISGLALGVDGVAHRTALENGGRTVAVIGGGHCNLYPPQHRELAEQIIAAGGAVLSEYPPLHPSASWTFPQRNRIVSALSLGVVVIEAPLKSGSMISARLAGEQGRDVFAVPGAIDSELSKGCHYLIKNGAYLVESADDILNVLGPMNKKVRLPFAEYPIRNPKEVFLSDIEQLVLSQIATTGTAIEQIVADTGLEIHQVLSAVNVLESRQIIRYFPPNKFARM